MTRRDSSRDTADHAESVILPTSDEKPQALEEQVRQLLNEPLLIDVEEPYDPTRRHACTVTPEEEAVWRERVERPKVDHPIALRSEESPPYGGRPSRPPPTAHPGPWPESASEPPNEEPKEP